jgi:hypothetical protein
MTPHRYRMIAPKNFPARPMVNDLELIELWYCDGLDTAEIAIRVGLPEHNVYARLNRIREEAREVANQDLGDSA